jgi:hypothetical protein
MRDDWLEMLEAQVGKKLERVEKKEDGANSYYRLFFEGGAMVEWHASLAAKRSPEEAQP